MYDRPALISELIASPWAIEQTRFVPIREHLLGKLPANTSGNPSRVQAQRVAARGGSVAVVPVEGALTKGSSDFSTSSIEIRRELRRSAHDPNVTGILLAIDSPGGTVAGTADLAADIRAARRLKPVWAQIEDLGASAAYWLASQCDLVFAGNDTALVGSIGTIITVYDTSAAAAKAGVKPLVFATGPLKGAGAGGLPVTADHGAYFQRIVNDAQGEFDAAVRSGRGFSLSSLMAVRSGEVFSAPTALARRLIDGIQSMDITLAQLTEGGTGKPARGAGAGAHAVASGPTLWAKANSYGVRAQQAHCRGDDGTREPLDFLTLPGCFTQSLAAAQRGEHSIRLLVDHDCNRELAATGDNSLIVWDEPDGVRFRTNPATPRGRNAVTVARSLGAGLGCSWGGGKNVMYPYRCERDVLGRKSHAGEMVIAELVELTLTHTPACPGTWTEIRG